MRAYYSGKQGEIDVELGPNESLGCFRGTMFTTVSVPGNVEYDALMKLVEAGTVTIGPYVEPEDIFVTKTEYKR